jgi:hypothetical protein
MRRPFIAMLAVLFACALLSTGTAHSKDRTGKTAPGVSKTALSGDFQYMDINRISTPIRNNGSFNRDPGSGNAGFEWPKGTGNTANYASGLWVGGKRGGIVRVAVAEYAYEFDAGPIINGSPATPGDARWRVYSIKRGDDATNSPDYAAWPWEDGAPVVKAADGTDSLDDSGSRIPELIGDQTMWCVFNDADVAKHTNMNTLPLGIEVQLTAFAFNRGDALGDNIFYKWKFINKSGEAIDSTFVTIWTDVDLGDSGDDLDGCDTTLGLGYTYNDGVDGVYGAQTPATGFDFLQGPLVAGAPTDTARFPDGRVLPGMRLLKMTSFIKYNNDATNLGNPNTGQEVFFYQAGVDRNGQAILDNNGAVTTFMFPGDPNLPLSSSNWIEAPGSGGDRRFMMTAGPFTMANGEEQEIVGANFIAFGASPTQSVTALKNADAAIQTAYELNFKLSSPPPSPIVSVTTLDKEILLSWGDGASGSARAISVEASKVLDPLAQAGGAADAYYNFEGYVVYQYGDAFGNSPKVVATFDRTDNPDGGPSPAVIFDDVFDADLGQTVRIPVKFGSNSGIKRSVEITKDVITNTPLSNAKDYYFGVTAYSYNAESVPKTLESAQNVIAVRPTKVIGGVLPRSTRGDTIAAVTRTAGASDGSVQAFVSDPSKVTGHTYAVSFSYDSAAQMIVWNVDDMTTGQRKLSNQVNQTGDDAYPTVDGIQIKVFGARNDAKGAIEVSNANGVHDPTQAFFLFNGSEFPTVIPCDPIEAPCDRPQANAGGGAWGIHTGADDGTGSNSLGVPADISYSKFVERVFRGTNFSRFVPYDFEIRFTAAGGMGYMRFTTENVVPITFELWNIGINTPDDPSDDYRMVPGILDMDNNDAFNLTQFDHPISGGDNDPYTDWIYWYNPDDTSPGQGGYDAWLANSDHEALLGGEVMARTVLVNFNAGSISDPTWPANVSQLLPETGTVIRVIATKPNLPNVDVFAVNTAGLQPSVNEELAVQDVNLINVVPNPYFGASAYERNQLAHIIRFTNLPDGAKIRIFTLAGVLVRTLDHAGPSTTEDWDIQNKDGLPVASGMYIAYVDVPGLGTKILKLAVILAEERLDNF